jgi:oligosaccharyltransferase complex subunit alpha (ribophorin I)
MFAVVGYSLPLEGFLYRRPDGKYRLLMDFGSPMDELYIEELEVRVVLPEGSEKISWTVRLGELV